MIVLYSDQKLPFGKYEGRTIEDVIKLDPDYFKRPVHYKFERQYAYSDEIIRKAYCSGITK